MSSLRFGLMPPPPLTHPTHSPLCSPHTNTINNINRGYGSSAGAPDPERVKQDGLRVARFLRFERRVCKLVIHGESIGGMSAAHVAAHCPP